MTVLILGVNSLQVFTKFTFHESPGAMGEKNGLIWTLRPMWLVAGSSVSVLAAPELGGRATVGCGSSGCPSG